jgi:hypothetical protein
VFEGRRLVIATMHQKESVMAPILEKELGVKCFVNHTFNTDTLGTFSGEVERPSDPVSTAREKCLQAMIMNDCDLGVASEGSFGPHPSFFFVSADDEILVFIDQKNHLELVARELSTETNFNGMAVKTEQELLDFAYSMDFPSHGIILRKSKDDVTEIHKGITDLAVLKTTFHHLHTQYHTVYAETDMRAMYNPTRMKVIQRAALKLVEKIKSVCPECHTPGFDITQARKGLECGLCGSPTLSTLCYVYQCQKCSYTKEIMYPHHKRTEDPMNCDFCNP